MHRHSSWSWNWKGSDFWIEVGDGARNAVGGEVFLGGKAGAFWDISPPRGESPLSGEAFEVDGEKCLI